MRPAHRARRVVNAVTLFTLLGLAVAAASGAALARGDDGLVLATGARGWVPRASAFTGGNLVIVRAGTPSPTLLRHEPRHATQWAACVVVFGPLCLLAVLWSSLRTADHCSRNVVERRAGLAEGGYEEHGVRRARRARAGQPRG